MKTLDQYIDNLIETGQAPGVLVHLTQAGSTLYSRAAGWADMETARPMDLETVFFIASSSKPVSATLMSLAQERGAWSLEDPLSRFLPAFDRPVLAAGGQAPCPTIAQCLSHTAGMFSLKDPQSPANRIIFDLDKTLAEVADFIAGQPLENPPGQAFAYGGASFMAAGAALEKAAGAPFAELMEEMVLAPLGMADTSWQPAEEGRVASIHVPRQGRLAVLNRYQARPIRLTRPPGGLYSTARDLTAFLELHLAGGLARGARLAREETLAAMRTVRNRDARVVLAPGQPTDYGLGWMLGGLDREGRARQARHGGAMGSNILFDLEKRLTGVCYVNMPSRPFAGPILAHLSELIAQATD